MDYEKFAKRVVERIRRGEEILYCENCGIPDEYTEVVIHETAKSYAVSFDGKRKLINEKHNKKVAYFCPCGRRLGSMKINKKEIPIVHDFVLSLLRWISQGVRCEKHGAILKELVKEKIINKDELIKSLSSAIVMVPEKSKVLKRLLRKLVNLKVLDHKEVVAHLI